MKSCPARRICVSTTEGLQSYGRCISPTSSKIGLGAWQSLFSCDGFLTKRLTTSQNGFRCL